MSSGRGRSLGRRLSGRLAAQSLIGLTGVRSAVYATTAWSFAERQSDTLLHRTCECDADAREEP